MKSLRLGKLFGIELELHWTFVFLALFVAGMLMLFLPQHFLPIIMLLFFLFLSVFLHELCHSIVAIQKNCKVKKIILLPIGGLSLTEELPENPKDEFIIAIVGPLFNFLVVFFLLLLVHLFPLPFPWHLFSETISPEIMQNAILSYPLFALLWVNLILGAFNLFLPAFPLDGGRVFRAILSIKFGYHNATQIATKISMFFAIFLFMVGLFGGGIIILIIAIFIFLGAQQEAQIVAIKEIMHGIDFSKLIKKNPTILSGELTVKEAITDFLISKKKSFLVKKKKGFGIVSVEDVIKEKPDLGLSLEIFAKEILPVQKNIPAEKLMEKFLVKGYDLMPVMDKQKFLGIVEFAELEKLYDLEKLKKTTISFSLEKKKKVQVAQRKRKHSAKKKRLKKQKKE